MGKIGLSGATHVSGAPRGSDSRLAISREDLAHFRVFSIEETTIVEWKVWPPELYISGAQFIQPGVFTVHDIQFQRALARVGCVSRQLTPPSTSLARNPTCHVIRRARPDQLVCCWSGKPNPLVSLFTLFQTRWSQSQTRGSRRLCLCCTQVTTTKHGHKKAGYLTLRLLTDSSSQQ